MSVFLDRIAAQAEALPEGEALVLSPGRFAEFVEHIKRAPPGPSRMVSDVIYDESGIPVGVRHRWDPPLEPPSDDLLGKIAYGVMTGRGMVLVVKRVVSE